MFCHKKFWTYGLIFCIIPVSKILYDENRNKEFIYSFRPGENACEKNASSGKSKQDILKETGCTVAVRNANLKIEEGELFVIMGLSGSGKSTLLRCINRLNEPSLGEVFINGKT